MDRRTLLRTVGLGAVLPLSGCLTRITGWSSLRVVLRNDLEDAVTVRFRVDVKGFEQVDRELGLEGGGSRQLELAVDVPYGATVRYHATLLDTGNADDTAFEASTPVWGGKCSFEAAVTIDEDGASIGPYCTA